MSSRRARVIAVGLACSALAGAASSAPAGDVPPRLRRLIRSASVTASGWHEEQRLLHDGVIRYYRYYVPPAMAAGAAAVVLLHGGTQSMRTIFGPNAGGTQTWRELADEHGFLLLVPNGTNAATGDAAGDDQNWNDCRADAGAAGSTADDVGFIVDLVGWARAAFGVDASRVYATGASNGGGMSYRLAIERPDVFAAVAVFIMSLAADSECGSPAAPIPVFICNGTGDPLVPWHGGGVAGGARGTVLSAAATLAAWLAADRAGPTPAEALVLPDLDPYDGCTVERDRYLPAAGGAEVEFCTVTGGGHTMPSIAHPLPPLLLALSGLGKQDRDLEGAREAWTFLSRQRLPAAP